MAEDAPAGSQLPEEIRKPLAEQARGQLQLIQGAAEVIKGEGAQVVDTFDPPTPDRNAAPMPDWTDDQTTEVKDKARQLGYGAEQDVISELEGAVAVVDPGKMWKKIAEVEAIKKGPKPSRIVYAGSPYRILGQDERDFVKENYGVDLPEDATEYDGARWLAERDISSHEESVLPFGYEVAEGNAFIQEETGQFLHLGKTSDSQEVMLVRIDREIYKDENENEKYRYQPDPSRVMGLLSEVLTTQGDVDSPVVLGTSNTYAARQVDAVRAGLKQGRSFGVTMYGRQTLRDLNAPVPKEMPLNHLPGDLRNMYDKLQLLQADLGVAPDSAPEE